MKKQLSNTRNVFLHQSKYIRISEREEKHIQQLLENFGTFENVPPTEVVTACYINKIKKNFIDSEDYFFFPVNEIVHLNETIHEKRRKGFLNFKSQTSEINSIF